METESSDKGLDIESTTMQSGFGYITTTNNKENGFCRAKVFVEKIKTTTILLPSHSLQEKPLPFQYISHEFDISQASSAVCIEH